MALNAFGGLLDPVGCLHSSLVMALHATVAHLMPCPAMPADEMQDQHRRAREGNMREIILRAGRIASLDERYSALVTGLRMLAKNYRTQAIVQFVERHFEGEHAS